MWKYRNTNEMYTNTNTHIYHSDVYLGEDFSDGIKHFKYIKKERKNGRWVYYYDNPTESKLLADQSKSMLKTWNYRQKTKNKLNWDKIDNSTKKLMINSKNNGNIIKGKLRGDADFKEMLNYADKARKYNVYMKNTVLSRNIAKIGVIALNAASSGISKGKKLLSKIFGWR